MVILLNEIYYSSDIIGDISNPNLSGKAYFRPFKDGVMIEIEINNLNSLNNYEVYSISINDGLNCNLNNEGKFNNINNVYNPSNLIYPYKNGNMPDLFSNNGYAYLKFYTTRFKAYDIEDKFVTIYYKERKIGCGKIVKVI